MDLYHGSIGRVTFLLGYAGFFVGAVIVAYLVTHVDQAFGPIAFVYGLVALPLVFSLLIRRLHDIDITGWLSLLFIVPVVNIIFFIALIAWPGSSTRHPTTAR
jgi:uncharacterized membrane protein YhaH (DUF805 family)